MTDKNKALNKMMAACARREICTYDVRLKLRRMELKDSDIEELIAILRKNQFIDDERYAKAFIREKLEINRWGHNKIKYAMRIKGFSDELISQILNDFENPNYTVVLDELLAKKLKQIPAEEDLYKVKARLIRFAASRGFEADLIYQRVDRLLKRHD